MQLPPSGLVAFFACMGAGDLEALAPKALPLPEPKALPKAVAMDVEAILGIDGIGQDLLDAFSALFAVKLPGMPGSYEASPQPLEQLLAATLSEPAAVLALDQSEPFVFLRAGHRQKLVRVPYPVAYEGR